MIIQAVVATDLAGVIGTNGSIPWHVPEDLKRFKEVTLGGSLIMGPKTFASLPGILPARRHIVVSSQYKEGIYESPESPQVWYCHSLDCIVAFLRNTGECKGSIIGGEGVYTSALAYLDKAYITTIHTVVDTFGATDVRYFPFDNLFEREGVLHKDYSVKTSVSGLRYSTAVWEKT